MGGGAGPSKRTLGHPTAAALVVRCRRHEFDRDQFGQAADLQDRRQDGVRRTRILLGPS